MFYYWRFSKPLARSNKLIKKNIIPPPKKSYFAPYAKKVCCSHLPILIFWANTSLSFNCNFIARLIKEDQQKRNFLVIKKVLFKGQNLKKSFYTIFTTLFSLMISFNLTFLLFLRAIQLFLICYLDF